jgi:Zn finger protein HypA/HybF involved in hydrogenase expression
MKDNDIDIKEISYKCASCGYAEVKKFTLTTIPKTPDFCPKCKRLTFVIATKSYVERMRENSCK